MFDYASKYYRFTLSGYQYETGKVYKAFSCINDTGQPQLFHFRSRLD